MEKIKNLYGNTKGLKQSKQSQEKQVNGAGGIMLPDFRLYYKATLIKTMMLSQKQTQNHIHSIKWDRMPRNNPTHLQSVNILQRRQEYTMEKGHFFNKLYSENQAATCERMKLKHSLTSYIKTNSK